MATRTQTGGTAHADDPQLGFLRVTTKVQYRGAPEDRLSTAEAEYSLASEMAIYILDPLPLQPAGQHGILGGTGHPRVRGHWQHSVQPRNWGAGACQAHRHIRKHFAHEVIQERAMSRHEDHQGRYRGPAGRNVYHATPSGYQPAAIPR